MKKFHVTVGGNSKNISEHEFLSKSIFKYICDFLKRTRDNLTSTSVKVVPRTLINMQKKSQQKVLQFGYSTAGKLPTVCQTSKFYLLLWIPANSSMKCYRFNICCSWFSAQSKKLRISSNGWVWAENKLSEWIVSKKRTLISYQPNNSVRVGQRGTRLSDQHKVAAGSDKRAGRTYGPDIYTGNINRFNNT